MRHKKILPGITLHHRPQILPTCHFLCHLFEVNASCEVHLARVDFEDVEAGCLVGIGELDLHSDICEPGLLSEKLLDTIVVSKLHEIQSSN